MYVGSRQDHGGGGSNWITVASFNAATLVTNSVYQYRNNAASGNTWSTTIRTAYMQGDVFSACLDTWYMSLFSWTNAIMGILAFDFANTVANI